MFAIVHERKLTQCLHWNFQVSWLLVTRNLHTSLVSHGDFSSSPPTCLMWYENSILAHADAEISDWKKFRENQQGFFM